MSHTVSGKLHKAPFIKTLADSTMFAIKLAEVTTDRATNIKVYANYDAVIFAKTQGQIDFYTNATAEGSFIVISCEKLQVKISDCGKHVNLSMENARLENANYGEVGAPSNKPAPQQAAPKMAPAYQPAPKPQQPPMTADDKSWLEAINNDPSVINQIESEDYKARIKSFL